MIECSVFLHEYDDVRHYIHVSFDGQYRLNGKEKEYTSQPHSLGQKGVEGEEGRRIRMNSKRYYRRYVLVL